MTSVQHALRRTLFGLVLGSGILLAGAAGVAAADSGVSAGGSSGSSSAHPGSSASPSVSRRDGDSDRSSVTGGVRASNAAQRATPATRRPPVRPVSATPVRGNRPTVTKPAVVRAVEPVEPEPPAEPVVYGNPGRNQDFFASRNWETAPLMSATMVLRQLTGAMVDPQVLVDQALSTKSRYRTGRTVYLGPGVNDSVWSNDVQELLSDRGVEVITRTYPKAQEGRALTNLQEALQDPRKAVTVNVSTPLDGWDKPHTHQVVVLGVDATNGKVYLNDAWSPTTGKAKMMTLADFLAAWANNYSTTIAQLPPAAARREPMTFVDTMAA
ncbi:hypothetical protein JRC04_26915 [Mycolicibacterium sp. S2-37]|uniref:hypothetical protein n=1 Tax=Mycolicibacterium sp. S2-37 TaxID=2810297 RepID=UPI001A95366F|nr:hypothetical protein [Mycolicibacterium sp. S2-37]MBO0681113.1 hypothetical protein [Mycolicibacterium sp. S2-37]